MVVPARPSVVRSPASAASRWRSLSATVACRSAAIDEARGWWRCHWDSELVDWACYGSRGLWSASLHGIRGDGRRFRTQPVLASCVCLEQQQQPLSSGLPTDRASACLSDSPVSCAGTSCRRHWPSPSGLDLLVDSEVWASCQDLNVLQLSSAPPIASQHPAICPFPFNINFWSLQTQLFTIPTSICLGPSKPASQGD